MSKYLLSLTVVWIVLAFSLLTRKMRKIMGGRKRWVSPLFFFPSVFVRVSLWPASAPTNKWTHLLNLSTGRLRCWERGNDEITKADSRFYSLSCTDLPFNQTPLCTRQPIKVWTKQIRHIWQLSWCRTLISRATCLSIWIHFESCLKGLVCFTVGTKMFHIFVHCKEITRNTQSNPLFSGSFGYCWTTQNGANLFALTSYRQNFHIHCYR